MSTHKIAHQVLSQPQEVETVHRAGIWAVHYDLEVHAWIVSHVHTGLKTAGCSSLSEAKEIADTFHVTYPDFGIGTKFATAPKFDPGVLENMCEIIDTIANKHKAIETKLVEGREEEFEGDDLFITTIHLDKDNKAYGYGESAEESVQDAIYQLAFTLTLDDKDSYHGFKVSLLPKHLQPLMIEQLKRRNIQLQKRTVKITCLIGEWNNASST